MKRLLLFLFSNILLLNLSIAQNPRLTSNFNRNWQFQLGDVSGAENIKFSDAQWQNIGLPHSFSMPYFLSSEFYTGYGWYRKHLTIDKNPGLHQFFLEFEGVFQVAEVYVNGILAGTHQGGYNGFSVDITKNLKKGDNLIAIRVNNLWNAQLAPRAGEHVFSGGIYRDVHLVETAPIHVAWYGTYITTPELSAASGKVNVRTEIENDLDKPFKGLLRTLLFDAEGKEMGTMETPFSAEARKTLVIDQLSSAINDPKLWSPATPYLYNAKTFVIIDNKVVDNYETTFGMRWIEWTADKGFFLNGKHHYFKGCNVHQDHAGWGDAVTNAGFFRDVSLMKEAGFDFIRGSHYPHDPAFSDACDQLGMLFWSENCFWGIGGFKPEGNWTCSAYPTIEKDEKPFEESVKNSLAEMIRIHRNHPSVIVWSMSNEPFFSVPEKMPKVRAFLKELVNLSHKLDATRPAAIGGCQRGEIDKLGDVAGYNGDGAKLYLDPGVASVVCEYGSTIADRPGQYISGYGDLQEEQFPWRSGQAIWCGFDHGSLAGHFGCMGLVDYFRIPKKQWYWYRKNYNNIEPDKWPIDGNPAAIRLTADKTTIKHADGTDDVHLTATIVDKDGNALSNSPDIKFEILSGPGEFPTGTSILFSANSDINIRDGKAAIEFRSYYAGKTVIRATSKGLIPCEIAIVSKNAPKLRKLKSMAFNRAYSRYRSQKTEDKSDDKINILSERPTKSSNSDTKYSSRLANDADSTTYWQIAKRDASPSWWQVDMENIYTLSEIKLSFREKAAFQYILEISMDGINWTTVVDQSANTSSIKTQVDIPVQGNKGRFLKLTFKNQFEGQLVNIADIEAYGIHVE